MQAVQEVFDKLSQAKSMVAQFRTKAEAATSDSAAEEAKLKLHRQMIKQQEERQDAYFAALFGSRPDAIKDSPKERFDTTMKTLDDVLLKLDVVSETLDTGKALQRINTTA